MSKVSIAIRDPKYNIVATVNAWKLKDFPEFAVHKHYKFSGGWTVSHVGTGFALLGWPTGDKATAMEAATKFLHAKDPSAIAKAVALAKRKIRAVKAAQ